ncbi:MAG: class I SAM-dependent methyltransferase [bacterium]|nr:class I SAM-dependent methyltransferase [bacterium]
MAPERKNRMRSSEKAVWTLILAVVLASVGYGFAAFNEESRDRSLQPERVMDAVGVKPGMTIGEVGAGRGYFTFKLAGRVGSYGRVFANDIDSWALSTLEDRAEDRGLSNIKTIVGEVVEPGFPERSLDMVFMVYALHDFERPVELLENLKTSLKPGAKVVILDEDSGNTGDGHFLSVKEVSLLFQDAGYSSVGCEDFLEHDLLCIFSASN